jgi:hypothetical protein
MPFTLLLDPQWKFTTNEYPCPSAILWDSNWLMYVWLYATQIILDTAFGGVWTFNDSEAGPSEAFSVWF